MLAEHLSLFRNEFDKFNNYAGARTLDSLYNQQILLNHKLLANLLKIRKAVKIRIRYNQVPHLTQDTTWESDKTQTKHHK